jgi:hypothetical protein
MDRKSMQLSSQTTTADNSFILLRIAESYLLARTEICRKAIEKYGI